MFERQNDHKYYLKNENPYFFFAPDDLVLKIVGQNLSFFGLCYKRNNIQWKNKRAHYC